MSFEQICVICTSELNDGYENECGHKIHFHCQIEYGFKCPFCRFSIETIENRKKVLKEFNLYLNFFKYKYNIKIIFTNMQKKININEIITSIKNKNIYYDNIIYIPKNFKEILKLICYSYFLKEQFNHIDYNKLLFLILF